MISANDEFFAPKEALLKPSEPEWREGVYTERGKWMDGWETRRRRSPGFDWAIIKLGAAGVVRGVVIDTSFFTGNYPERASIDGLSSDDVLTADELSSHSDWRPLLPETALQGNAQNEFAVDHSERVTYLRLNIFPDGGVARLRVFGDVVSDERVFAPGREVDLAAMENGAYVVACSDMHYGHRQNLILPGRSTHMGDGWETRRRRGSGNDWTIVRLARRGAVERVEIDTDHFKGNAPGRVMVESCDAATSGAAFDPTGATWATMVDEVAVQPHSRHIYRDLNASPATHVRLNIYPDGGVARLRLFGRAAVK